MKVSAMLRPLARWETFLLGMIALDILAFSVPQSPWYTPYFFDWSNMLGMSERVIAVGLMALPLTLIVIAGQIDLSVESMLVLGAVVFATKWDGGLNIWLALLVALVVGALGGLFNGLVVTRIKLPSLVVTLGTFALFRGLAQLVLGDHSVSLLNAPKDFFNIGQGYIGNTPVRQYLVLFVVLAIIFGLVLHRTSFGRYIYAIGSNEEACRYSGVRVDLIIIILFVVSGIMAALSGVLQGTILTSVKGDMSMGLLLDVVTAVVLGGVDIFGGRGSILGPVLALILIALLRGGIGFLLVSEGDEVGNLMVGMLLICSILLPNVVQQMRTFYVRRGYRTGRTPVGQ